jgi:hypothetical protein
MDLTELGCEEGGWKWPWIMSSGGFGISDIHTSGSAVKEGEWIL